MKVEERTKRISVFLPISVWQKVRNEAARRKVSMAVMCKGWMDRDLNRMLKARDDK